MSPVPKEGWGALGVGVKSNGIYILYVLTESRTQELKHSPGSPGSPGCSSTHSDHQHTPSQVGLQAWDRRWGAWYRRNLTLIQQRAFLTASLSPPVPAPPNSPPGHRRPWSGTVCYWETQLSDSGLGSRKVTHTTVFRVWGVQCLLLLNVSI